ncbi:MAG: class I SAM-dependent methyltransferase [Acidimicrobiia bacterium]
MSNVETWDRAAGRYQQEFDPPDGVVHYGPGLPDDAGLRIVPGHLGGRRVLELGCGAGQAAIAFARMGARTIAVDSSPEMLAGARRRAEWATVGIDFRLGDLCDLAFVPAESIDLVFSAATIDYVEDLGRVLRSVHRVLRPQGAFVFSLEHPVAFCLETTGSGGPALARSYADPAPVKIERYGEAFLVYPRTISEVVATLGRAGFRVEALAEPAAADPDVPAATVWRTRKVGR